MPENSWPAIRLGHQWGADLIEMDVQLSRDGVPFLRHNYQLPDGRWCHDLSWEELKALTIDGESFPALEDVLVWARNLEAHLSLDLKTFFRPEGSLIKEVIRLLELTVRALLTGRLFNYAGYIQQIRADCISVSYGILRPEDIERFHAVETAVVLVEYWNKDGAIFQKFDIDVLSCGSPQEARKILSNP